MAGQNIEVKLNAKVPIKPTDPTAKPKRRNITAPKMVEIAVKKQAMFRNWLSN